MKNDRSTSGYLTDKYEGLSTAFADVEQQPSTGYCDLFRVKRFGRWYLLKCLRPELQGDEAYRQMLRKSGEAPGMKGDMNGDDSLDMEDVTLLINKILGKE